jgi:hypothetical protein
LVVFFTNPVLKHPICVKAYKNTYFLKKCFVLKYGLVSPIYIYINIMTSSFSYNKENFKTIYVLTCILALITSLFKPWELGQYFKNSKKIFLSLGLLIYT